MYTLYYMPGACSMAVHAVLNELNQPVKLVQVGTPGEPNHTPPAEFLKANPRGMVPTLVEDGHVVREGAAIMVYLLTKHKSPLLPQSGKEHATALEWLMFCNATLHPAYGRTFFAMKNFEGETKDKLMKAYVEQINKLWGDVETQLGKSTYLAGNDCTVADILITVIANWSGHIPGNIQIGPKTKALLTKVIARPAYQKALATEKVEYKAAA